MLADQKPVWVRLLETVLLIWILNALMLTAIVWALGPARF